MAAIEDGRGLILPFYPRVVSVFDLENYFLEKLLSRFYLLIKSASLYSLIGKCELLIFKTLVKGVYYFLSLCSIFPLFLFHNFLFKKRKTYSHM